MLTGFGITTITLGIIAAVGLALWGIIQVFSTPLFGLFVALAYVVSALFVLVFFVGIGLLMVRFDRLYNSVFKDESN